MDEKYQVRIAAIVYLEQDRSNFTIWQLDINCDAENCTRSTIFQETIDQIRGTVADLTIFSPTRPPTTSTTTLPANSLTCYKCFCNGSSCPCNNTEVVSADNSYCSIRRTRIGQSVSIEYGHTFINPSYYTFSEYPFLFNRESITYNEGTGRWDTQPEFVIYGCDSSFCNSPRITPYMASSFVMRLSESWLNTSILGTGQSAGFCHQCVDDTVCSNSSFIDITQCPYNPCNTTCLVSDRFNDPTTGGQCYFSICGPQDDQGFSINPHRVDIEGVLYPSTPNTAAIREIDIYCLAQNCSRPEIFQEIRDDLEVITSDLSIIFNQTIAIRQRRCFNCSCSNISNCVCDTVSKSDAETTFCAIERHDDGTNVITSFTTKEIGTLYANVCEYPFVWTQESIAYDDAADQWVTSTDTVLFGCNQDYCNDIRLASLLPANLNIIPPEAWLNSTVLGTGESTFDCYNCTSPLCSTDGNTDVSSCELDTCGTTCFGGSSLNDITMNEQCYQSSCVLEQSGPSANQSRVEMQAIVYENTPSVVEFWRIDIYCRTDNCSRPETFQELKVAVGNQARNLSTFFQEVNTEQSDQLSCYQCSCQNDPICACDKIRSLPATETHCTIIRLYQGQNVFLYLEHINRNSSGIYIRDFPYMLVEESILYDESRSEWNTYPTLVVYGCTTNFCNDPYLIPSLPINFEMRLPDSWLNTNILGTESSVGSCHQCPNVTYCGTTDFIDISRCPSLPCNTSCFVADIFEDPDTNEACYQATCLSADEDPDKLSGHRIEIEGIIYGNNPNPKLDFWVIEIYCRAVDCSRPEIFQELQDQLDINIGDLSAFFNQSIVITKPMITTTTTTPAPPMITCYDCYYANGPIGFCNKTIDVPAGSQYCTIIRQDYPEGFFIAVEPIRRNNTQVYIREFPFLLVEESILHDDDTGQWYIRNNLAIFGCNTDYCNNPSLIPYLPNSFQMNLPNTWLDQNVLGTGQPAGSCHECPNSAQCGPLEFIDIGRCPSRSCNTTCVVLDFFNPDENEQCYRSYCAPPDSELVQIDRARVEMEGILYLYPIGRPVELWEVDVYCRVPNCSRPEIFNEVNSLRKKFQK